jgi:hypothetical protein
VFLALGIGFVVGPMKVAGFNLGNVTFFMALMNGWAYPSPIDNSYGPIRKKSAFLMPRMDGNAGKDAIKAFQSIR